MHWVRVNKLRHSVSSEYETTDIESGWGEGTTQICWLRVNNRRAGVLRAQDNNC